MASKIKREPATRESVAYDYSRLETNVAQQAPQMQVHHNKAPATAPYGKYMAICCAVFAVLCVIVFNYMRVTELTNQNSKIRTELAQLQSDENALNAKKEQIFNLSYVEDRAKNALGMVKMDKSQASYLDLSQGDAVVLNEGKGNAPAFITGIFKAFNAVVEYIK